MSESYEEEMSAMGDSLVSQLLDLFCNAERRIVGIYAFAYLLPILVVLIGRIPISDSNVASLTMPFSFYVAFFPLSIVFFGPFFPLLPLTHFSYASEPLAGIGWSVLYGSVLFYPVLSYYLLRGAQVAWILSFASSFATISLHVYLMGTDQRIMLAPIWSLFGIIVNCLVLYLLYSSRNEFSSYRA